MYLTYEETKEKRRLESEISSIERKISKLEADYEKFRFPVITSGSTYTRVDAQIKEEINKAKAQKERLEEQLRKFYSSVAADRRKINERAQENRREKEEKISSFRVAQGRWESRNVFYKLFHRKIRPDVILKEFGDWTTEEINGLYRKR